MVPLAGGNLTVAQPNGPITYTLHYKLVKL